MNDAKMVAMTARMDGTRAIAGRIGKKRKLSEMELIALCNFARVGLLCVFSGLDGQSGKDADAECDRLIEVIRKSFGKDGKADGLECLSECCVAILGGERLGRYIVEH